MTTTLLLNASRSTLMHASLANLTPELLVLDDIIQTAAPRRKLPTELLLIIRGHLLRTLSADLIAQSAHTLASYEQSLISLLCADCASYNADIYGPNVWDWPWEQFSGPCLCRGDIDDCLKRTKAFTDKVTQLQCEADKSIHIKHIAPLCRRSESGELFSKGELLQFSPQLLDADFILELHLSRQARRLARLAFKRHRSTLNRGRHGLATKPNSSDLPEGFPDSDIDSNKFLAVRSIWDAVKLVLRDRHGCEIIQPLTSDTIATPSFTTIPFINKSTTPCNRYDSSHSGRLNHRDGDIVELQVHEVELLSKITGLNGLFLGSGSASLTSRRQHEQVYISLARTGHRDLKSEDQTAGPNPFKCHLTTINPGYRDRSPVVCSLTESLEELSPTADASAVAAPVQDPYGIAANSTEDPWISRALLARAKHDLGLDIDYSSYQIPPFSHSSTEGYYCSSCNSGAATTQLTTTSSGAESHSVPSSSSSSLSSSFAGAPATKPYPSTHCLPVNGATETPSFEENLDDLVVAGEGPALEEEVAIGITDVTTDGGSSEGRCRFRLPLAQGRRRGAEATTSTSAFALGRLLSWSPSSSFNSGTSMTGVKVQSAAPSQLPPTPETPLAVTAAVGSTSYLQQRSLDNSSTSSQLRCQQQCGCFHRYAASSDSALALSSNSPPGTIVFSLLNSRVQLSRFIVDLLKVLTAFLAACVCVPFAFISFALTILCFYSRPRSLRIL